MKFREYIDRLDFDQVWPHIGSDRDEETVQLMEGDSYRFEQIFAAIPDSKEPIKLLDIGTTPFTFFIKESYPHYEVATLDLTNLAEDLCRARGIRFRAHDLAIQPIPFERNSFDVVIFSETLEHLFAPPTEVLKEIYRIIVPDGKLIFTVPNFAALNKRIKLLFGLSPMPNPDEQMKKGWVHGYGHPREYTMKECLTILKAAGFIIVKKMFIHPPLWSAKRMSNRRNRWLLSGLFYPVYLLIPPFRAKIYLECCKAIKEQE